MSFLKNSKTQVTLFVFALIMLFLVCWFRPNEEKIENQRQKIRQEGKTAAQVGQSHKSNPYWDVVDRNSWLEGWAEEKERR